MREVILPLTTKPTGVVDYHVSDNVASLRVSLIASGVQGIYDYDPWGNPLPLMGGAVTGVDRSTFNEQERDAETGLYDLSARKYDGEIGRFTSIDPLWEQERAQTPYNYCRNNPVELTDPSGLQTQEEDGFLGNHIKNRWWIFSGLLKDVRSGLAYRTPGGAATSR